MIDILLATYNGQAFLPAQLDSLLHQTYQDFLIHIRDDGSADATLQIIEQYKTNYPGKISVLENPIPSGSAKSNFFHLLNEADMSGDYFLLCDQDDVWNPDKVELTLREMTKLEATYGTQTPLLIHTDLAVVDQSLRPLARSFV
ncbi:MAG: glycosyltransferase, partial [Oscillospiraceae bacterium]|nr:glycosyltransferase [Oscillospiraceae bacterium]